MIVLSNCKCWYRKKRSIAIDNIIKDIRNLFKKEKKDNGIKYRVLRDIRTLFESHEKDYYKPIRIGDAFSDNYFECENNADKDKKLLKLFNWRIFW